MMVLFVLVYNRVAINHFLHPDISAFRTLAVSTEQLKNNTLIDSCVALAKDGDLILRAGNDRLSDLFIKANAKDKTYSHAGLVFIENGYPMVYNLIGSTNNPYATIRRDSIHSFINAKTNTGFAIYRYAISHQKTEDLHQLAIQHLKDNVAFDPHFDLATDSLLYCTEFIYKAMAKITGNKNYFTLTQTANFSYVAVDNLYYRKDTKLICKFVYIK